MSPTSLKSLPQLSSPLDTKLSLNLVGTDCAVIRYHLQLSAKGKYRRVGKGKRRKMIMKIRSVAVTTLAVMALLFATALVVAFIVYVFAWQRWILQLFCVAEVFALIYLGFTLCIGIMSGYTPERLQYLSITAAGLFLIWLFNGFALYLATVWGLDLDNGTYTVLSLEQRTLDFIALFFIALIKAVTGIPLELPTARPPEMPSGAGGYAPALGPVLQWMLDSFWNIVLGIVSGVLCAVVVRSKN